jgi:glycosyltransferase involved in cell wall biosynthesis
MLVSIITISLNSETHLEETIKSVLEQDYPDIEYIIVDGGSTDGTLDIVRKYSDRIARWVSEPDEGISDAMNKGIGMATGDVIGLIHSDDYYYDETVVRRVAGAFAWDDRTTVVYGIMDFIDPETGEVILEWGRHEAPSAIRQRMYMPHPTMFCRREVYETAGLFRKDYRAAMDYEWAMRVTKQTRQKLLDFKIACMRDMGTSGQYYDQTFKETVMALNEHGYYFDALKARARNLVKKALYDAGLRSVVKRVWSRNVNPRV